ncbi:Uncharacterised protein [Vibrio cholerae]|nr:Uncharacterised protein [Vibrio cholerae]
MRWYSCSGNIGSDAKSSVIVPRGAISSGRRSCLISCPSHSTLTTSSSGSAANKRSL